MSPAGAPAVLHVLVTADFPAGFLQRVSSVDERIVVHHHPPVGHADVVPPAVLGAAEVVYAGEVLPHPAATPALRWVQLDTSGIDHVRASPLWDSDVVITTLGGVSPAPLAEWVLMMILVHAHHLRATQVLAEARRWPSRAERWQRLMPRDLRRSTVGIVGYGRIGREIARLCQALGMSVLAVRRGPEQRSEGQFGRQLELRGVSTVGAEGLRDVLAASDYVVLTVPLTPQTEGMIGPSELSAMKPGAILINGSRGGVVDETALLAALDSGHVDLAASDVFAEEPLPPDSPLWSHPRSVVTPHIAGFAPDYLEVVGELFTQNLRRYLDGATLLNVAYRERGY